MAVPQIRRALIERHHDARLARGEKKLEKEGDDRSIRERFYGRFERRVALDREVDEGAIKAGVRNGLLTVTIPKSAKAAEKIKRIPINSGGKTH